MGDGTPSVDDQSKTGNVYTIENITFPSCEEIRTFRNNIGLRFLSFQPPPEPRNAGGFMYTPERESAENNARYKENAKSFMEWARTAQPSPSVRNFPDWKLRIIDNAWNKGVRSEGAICSVNAWDFENLFTWGRGFASAGALQDILFRLINQNQNIKESMRRAGITIQVIKTKLTFVLVDVRDCQQSNNLKMGVDAIKILRKDQRLISLFVNIGQGELLYEDRSNSSVDAVMRQKVLDVQWLKYALIQNYPDWTRSWEDDARNLASHNILYGGDMFKPYNPAWNLFQPCDGTLKGVVEWIGKVWGKTQLNGTKVLEQDQTNHRLLLTANGVAKKVLKLNTGRQGDIVILSDSGGLIFLAPLTEKEKRDLVLKWYTLKS